MSWFNLNVNESLNTLKGQISNVSHVVQGVLTEGILEDTGDSGANEHSSGGGGRSGSSDDTILLGLEAANKRIDDLSLLCQDKDEEVRKCNKSVVSVSAGGRKLSFFIQQQSVQRKTSVFVVKLMTF